MYYIYIHCLAQWLCDCFVILLSGHNPQNISIFFGVDLLRITGLDFHIIIVAFICPWWTIR